MASLVCRRLQRPVASQVRCLATHASSGTASRGNFKQALADGPSFDDFISGNVPERVTLGNTSAYVQSVLDSHNAYRI